MADVRAIFSLSMKDSASKQLEAFRRNWQSTTNDIESGGGGLEDALGGFLSSGVGKIAGVVGGAFATGAVASMTFELARTAAETERVRNAFERLAAGAGQSGAAMLNAMRTAARGTIDDSSLMLAANRAMTLGVVRNTEQMTKLIEAAIIRGRDLGVSATQAVDDLVTGIGRMSPQILDNLGIVGAAEAIEKYAASLGKTADTLTDVEKKQALLNSVLASTEGVAIVDDAAAAFERMDASIENMKNALGILFSPAIAGLADGLAAAANVLIENWRQAGNEMEQMLSDLDNQSAIMFDRFATTGDTAAQAQAQAFETLGYAIDQANAALSAGVPGAQSWGDTLAFVARESLRTGQISESNLAVLSSLVAIMQQAEVATGGFAAAQAEAAPVIDAVTQKLLTQAEAARQEIAKTMAGQSASLRSAMLGMVDVLGGTGALSQYQELNAELQRRTELMQAWGYTAERIEFENAAWIAQVTDALRQQASVYNDLAASGSDALSEIQSAAQGGLAQIAQSVAEVQGMDAGVAWLRDANMQLAQQIQLWIEAGYSISEITAVLLPQYLANLKKIAGDAQRAATATASIGKGAQQAGTIGARMMAGLAIKIGTVTRAAQTAALAISQMAAVSSARGGGLGEGFRKADYVPIEKATDSTTALDMALSGLLDTAYTGGSGGGGIGGIADEFGSLQSTIQGVIDQAMSADIGGLDPAAFLPREDAINENARRLAAIMRDGIAGQEWLDEFKAEVPALWEELSTSGDPKSAAARMLQEFQQGLRPELLDKEMIKARVKAMILGEENTAALAQEIAAELSSELGVSMAQAQQAVSGVMGTTGSTSLVTDGATQGTQFVAAWSGMVKSQLSEFENTGRQAGASWGAGFMATVESGVPGQLISLLVSLVTPGVLANIAAQGSRTGAQ